MNHLLTTRKERKADGQLTVPPAPAPWTLEVENSWVFPFRVTPSRLDSLLRARREDRATACPSGLGVAMIIRYSGSPAGPYDELLFGLPVISPKLPGEWLTTRRLPVIYVSSEASLRNGRKNWGIRKELADFEWSVQPGYLWTTTSVKITDRITRTTLIEASFTTFNICIPIHLSIFGKMIPAIVEQQMDEEGELSENREWLKIRPSGFGLIHFFTTHYGLGWTRPSFISANRYNASSFPSLRASGALIGVNLNGILYFPTPDLLRVKQA